jgi:hypothetical protein
LWHADPLVGGDREIGDCTAAVARQWSANNRGMLFSVRSVPRCYKQGRWSNGLVVGQSPAGRNVSTEAEDIVGIRHQATIGEDTAD